MTLATDQLDRLAIDTIRTLSIDGVQQANSGHPGAPMGAAPMAYAVWTRHLRHAPTNPHWPNRDRFVLSAGHASMLLYSLLHLTGYGVSLDDLKSFRQWGSITPGHPEYGLTPGVEATTGPLGQGLGNAVGMAIAERRLAAEFNRPGHDIVDHRTYVIASDGDMQEGVASEASSIAGHLRLGRLIVLYDDNRIQLDGPTAWAFSEDVLGRYAAYGWHTQRVEDGTDVAAISAAIDAAKADERPSIIAVRTHIGFGSPNKQDTQKAHGAPLGPDEVAPRQGGLRLGPGPDVLRAGRGREAVPSRDRRGQGPRRRVGVAARPVRGGVPGGGRGAGTAAARPAARRLGRGPAGVRGRHRGRDAEREPGHDPGAGGAAARAVRWLGGPVGVEPDRRQGERPGPLRGRPRRAATCASASASTAWARSRTASPTTAASSPTARRSSPSATTCAGPCGWRPCPACTSPTSGPTTPSASARTGRRTSRSSTTRRSGRSRTCGSCGPATPTRRPRPGRWRSSGRRSRARRPARSRSRSPARSCRRWRARRSTPARACGAAATCCARPRAGSPS